jgi:hypothetical protein
MPKAQKSHGYPGEMSQVVFETVWQNIFNFPPKMELCVKLNRLPLPRHKLKEAFSIQKQNEGSH